MYEKGQSVREIRGQFNLTSDAIYAVLKKAEVPLRKTEKPIVANLYKSGVSAEKISGQFGISTSRVYGIAAEQKVQRKIKPRVEKPRQPDNGYDPEIHFPDFPSVITEDIGCYRHGTYPLGSIGTFSNKGGYEQRPFKQTVKKAVR